MGWLISLKDLHDRRMRHSVDFLSVVFCSMGLLAHLPKVYTAPLTAMSIELQSLTGSLQAQHAKKPTCKNEEISTVCMHAVSPFSAHAFPLS